jgi:hypothetical protein
MDVPAIAVDDANVLYPAPLRDLLIRVAQSGLVRARWTDTIHDEWVRSVLKDNPRLSPERLAHVLGHPLGTNQQVVIGVVNLNDHANTVAPPRHEPANGTPSLPEWCNVYAGLSNDEIAVLERSVL